MTRTTIAKMLSLDEHKLVCAKLSKHDKNYYRKDVLS